MFYASMDPSITLLTPKESTQQGSYVYAGIDPGDCFTMATFRLSTLFRRQREKETEKRQIIDVFPGTIEKILQDKFVTIYRLPEQQFFEYVRSATSSPNREWVSKDKVIPQEEVTFEAMDLLNYIKSRGLLNVIENHDEVFALESLLPSSIDIWNLKKIQDSPNVLENGKMFKCAYVFDFAPQYKTVVKQFYRDLFAGIENYNKEYFKIHQDYPDFSSEDEYHISILTQNLLPQIRSRKAIEGRLRDINSKKITVRAS